MEESEKRRERLRAMRMEAQAEAPINNPSSSSPLNLANPLLHSNEDHSSATPRPRFDFYTDPVAAFSRSPNNPGPRNSDKTLYGVHQSNYAPHPSMRHGGDPSCSPNPSQMGVRPPYLGHEGGYPSYSHNSSQMGVRTPYFGDQGGDSSYRPSPMASPIGFRSSNPMHQGSPSFSPGSGRGGSQYPVQGSPSFRPPPQGWGPQFTNSPSHGLGYVGNQGPNLARGRGRGDGSWMSPGGSGRGRGRGRGRDNNSQSHSYYDRSMVEDPWESLTPVIWQSVWNKWGSSQMTPTAKKARVSHSSSNSNSKSSLAEFLAAAVDEAVGADA